MRLLLFCISLLTMFACASPQPPPVPSPSPTVVVTPASTTTPTIVPSPSPETIVHCAVLTLSTDGKTVQCGNALCDMSVGNRFCDSTGCSCTQGGTGK